MSKKKKSACEAGCPSRLNRVGGQAVLEGVMMKAGEHTVTTCRKEDGSLAVTDGSFVSIRKKLKFLNIPILRGVVNFIEMMKLSITTLGASADAMGLDEEENPGRFERWLKKRLGIRLTDLVMVISVILGLGLSVLLFLFLPIWVTAGVNLILELCSVPPMGPILTAIVEGLIKVGVFITYLSLVSLMPDIKRTFMYHGAEHKSIACFESGDELTPQNAMKHRRFHPRCGTSFMFFMILLGIFAGILIKTLIPGLPTWAYSLIRLGILPILMGIGYEVIMLAGKHDNIVTRIISAPGMWVQRITTKEPTEDMLEVAIVSIKCALRDDFPEFKEFFEAKAWEPAPKEPSPEGDEAEADVATVEAEANATAEAAEPAEAEANATAEMAEPDSNAQDADSTKAEVASAEISEASVAEASAAVTSGENLDTESAKAKENTQNCDTPSVLTSENEDQ
ncbi:MAG: DUF1385 domain-containing protein [Clostridia bacterium]|nr:DUF1385 domain-containing protein [Clostridia bacterium]